MGLFDPLLTPAVSPGQPYPLFMSAAQAEQARAIVRGLTDALRRTAAADSHEESVSVNLGGAIDGLEEAVRSGFARTVSAVEAGNGEVTVGLDKLREGIAALGADFHWAMGEVVWQFELQGRTLTELKARLDEPRGTKAREVRRWAEQCHAGGLYPEAVEFYREAEKLCPIDFVAQRSLGHLYMRAGEFDLALEYFRKAARYASLHDAELAAEAHLFAARACERNGDLGGALTECLYAMDKNPRLHEAKFFFSQCEARFEPEARWTFRSELTDAIRGDGRYFRQAEEDPALAAHPDTRPLLDKLDKDITACLREQKRHLAAGRLPEGLSRAVETDFLPEQLKGDAEMFRIRLSWASGGGLPNPCLQLAERVDAALASDFCERFAVSQFIAAVVLAPDPET